MYNNQSDPYAGQYPPPPPIQSPPIQSPPISNQPIVYDQHNNDNTYTNFSTPLQHQQIHIPQQQQQEAYIPPPAPVLNNDTDYYSHQPQYSQQYHHQPQGQYNDYYDTPHQHETAQTSLDAYLRQEREEYLKHEIKPQEDNIPLNVDSERAPMLEHQKPEYQPHIAKPTLAPQQNEAEGYQQKTYEPRQRKRCNCCCYNPAITCCSFFMLLVSIAFCVGGIALIIASKVISSKCDSNCSTISSSVESACNTICNTVLQKGLFYGGIVVAGLAGIAIIWKLVMWTCAGYSQRH